MRKLTGSLIIILEIAAIVAAFLLAARKMK